MYKADLRHSNPKLEEKLQALYGLNRGEKNIDLAFRPPFMDLLKAFGNPQDHLPPIIHVAGTNGKGSTIATLKSIYEAAGYSVHTYTSPHLIRFNERIVLNGKPIEDGPLEALIDEAIKLNAGRDITFFEITTAMAFAAFMRQSADLLLLEVGMGGRLDCTNIISKPNVSIINRISKDHTEFLGNTISEIAYEKGGIIKYETPCIVGYQDESLAENGEKTAVDTLVDIAEDKKAPLYCAGRDWFCEPSRTAMTFTHNGTSRTWPRPNLLGDHQCENAGAALIAIEILKNQLPVTDEAIEKGLTSILWPGRLENITEGQCAAILPTNWQLWYDGGHNDSAGRALGQQVQSWNKSAPLPYHLIIGMKGDKDPKAFLEHILPFAQSCTVIPLHGVGPCVNQDAIATAFTGKEIPPIHTAENVAVACKNVVSTYGPDQNARILVCGSLYLAGQL